MQIHNLNLLYLSSSEDTASTGILKLNAARDADAHADARHWHKDQPEMPLLYAGMSNYSRSFDTQPVIQAEHKQTALEQQVMANE